MKKLVAGVVALVLWMPLLAWSEATIAEAKLGTDVVDRELTGEASIFALNEKAFLWMRVTDGEGESITVTWRHGAEEYPVTLSIGSNSWRTWSSKVLHLSGEWSVTVTNPAGTTIYETTLTVQ
ncbi:MAG: DUF2914 domain-containing protein [Burkholderiales bacterium]|jgi:hypothetical protein